MGFWRLGGPRRSRSRCGRSSRWLREEEAERWASVKAEVQIPVEVIRSVGTVR